MTTRAATLDELTLRALVAADRAELTRLHAIAERRTTGGACPECNAAGPHLDNGATRADELSWCCEQCGTQWDANEG